jgi:hypothetical protein
MNLNEVRSVFERQNPTIENPKATSNHLLIAGVLIATVIGIVIYLKQKEKTVVIKKKV